MTAIKNIRKGDQGAGPEIELYVSRLKQPAKRTKQVLQNALEKSILRFQDIASKSDSEETKSLTLRKMEKIASDLEMLKVLSEDEIIRYAVLMINKIMPIASNPRIPRGERMKARVAAHKPLSTHLARLKQRLKESQEAMPESEEEKEISSSTLNKISFNNIVVLMRKYVRRAKVYVIHKLTRTIQKLRTAKGKEEKVAKFLRKAERLHKKVIHIKELHEDDVSKFALSTTQNLTQLSTDIKAPTSSQALATIAVHEFVAAHVRNFRIKYPDWQKIVPNLLKKKNKKRKLNLETEDNKKDISELPQPSKEGNDNHSESENSLSESDLNNSDTENDHSESEPSEKESRVKSYYSGNENDNSENDSETNNTDLDSDNKKTQYKNCTKVASNSYHEVSSKNKHKSHKNVKKEGSEETIMSPDDSHMLGKTVTKKSKNGLKIEEKPSSLQLTSNPVRDEPKVIDPFFVTTTNEEYVTSQVPPSSGIQSFSPRKTDKLDYTNKWERSGGKGNFANFRRFKESAPYEKHSPRSFNKKDVSTRSDKIIFGNRKERRKALHQPQVEEKVEQLHPSWEAKKKQSNIIPFQGKKVTFD